MWTNKQTQTIETVKKHLRTPTTKHFQKCKGEVIRVSTGTVSGGIKRKKQVQAVLNCNRQNSKGTSLPKFQPAMSHNLV